MNGYHFQLAIGITVAVLITPYALNVLRNRKAPRWTEVLFWLGAFTLFGVPFMAAVYLIVEMARGSI